MPRENTIGTILKECMVETVQEFDTQYMSLFLFLAFTLKLEHYKWKGEIHIKDHMLWLFIFHMHWTILINNCCCIEILMMIDMITKEKYHRGVNWAVKSNSHLIINK